MSGRLAAWRWKTQPWPASPPSSVLCSCCACGRKRLFALRGAGAPRSVACCRPATTSPKPAVSSPSSKTHLEIARTDRPQPYPGRITFFAAEETLAGWEDTAAIPADHGWAALAAETEVVPVPGNHVTLIRDAENVRVLAEKIDVAVLRTESS